MSNQDAAVVEVWASSLGGIGGSMLEDSLSGVLEPSRPGRARTIRMLWACVALMATQSLTGCALLHRPDDDKTAQSASKSFDEAELGKMLGAERNALTKAQRERHELVKRSQFALRDATLAAVIGGTTPDSTWGALQNSVDLRMKYLLGSVPTSLPENCNPSLSSAQIDRDFANTKVLLAADKVKQIALNLGETVPLSCTKQPTPLAPNQMANISLNALVQAYDRACGDLTRKQACVSAHLANGELKLAQSRIETAENEHQRVKDEIAEATKAYKEALAVADDAKPTAGAAQNLANALQKRLDDINALAKKVDGVNDKATKVGFAELANLESLEQRKEILDSYIKALQGADPGAKDLPQHRTYLVANLVNRASEKPAPPTAGIVLQAELYRQQIANSQARLHRVDETLEALRARYAALAVELAELQKARLHLADAASSKGHCNQAVSLYESLSAGKGCEIHVGGVLLAFNNAWTLGRMPAELADYRQIDVQEQIALDESEAGLMQTQTVLRASLDQIVKLNAAGIKPEEVAALWQALGITAIAIRVK
ncbi:hypothetical protein [Comamonas thiooxydans]|uniref:hypothetical protein n=1 Tax=Comamonas thiooxydans TaxID=363952 RepID=UPI000A8BCAB2|nr:hypothetical protein [Comamonas thiooxydans]